MESCYIGIDLSDKCAMVSFYQPNMKEPETTGTIAGSEVYQIPTLLAKRKHLGQWYYGTDAKKMAKTSEVICIDSLLKRAVNGESIRIENRKGQSRALFHAGRHLPRPELPAGRYPGICLGGRTEWKP